MKVQAVVSIDINSDGFLTCCMECGAGGIKTWAESAGTGEHAAHLSIGQKDNSKRPAIKNE